MKQTLNQFIADLELLKEEYIKRGYRDYNTADRQSYGQFVELSTILFQLKKIQEIELPTDEEIEQEAYYKVSDDTKNPYASFKSGVKWIKEQIINQKK
jgi:hypothetical protein